MTPPAHAPKERALLLGLTVFGVWLFAPWDVEADIVYLRNGNQIQGEVVRRADQKVTVRFPGGSLDIAPREILRIETESRLSYLMSEGEKHIGRKDFRGALEFLELAEEEFPGSGQVKERLSAVREQYARSLLERRCLDEAREAFTEILERTPRHHQATAALRSIDKQFKQAQIDEARAIHELTIGSFASSHEKLKKIYADFPDRRESIAEHLGTALIGLGNQAAERDDFTTAETRYREAITTDPDLVATAAPGYVAIKIRQLRPRFELNDHEALLAGAESALEVLPSDPVLNYFRGHALEGLGRWKEAAEVYLRVTGQSRPRDLKASLEVLKRTVETKILGAGARDQPTESPDAVLPGKWREIRTQHFVIYHRNNTVGRAVAQVAESSYERLFHELELTTHWYKPCKVYIYPSRDTFFKRTGNHNWMGGVHRVTGNTGALAQHQIETFQQQPRLAQTVIPHEIAHAMFIHRLRYRGTAPIWLKEGFAIWAEPEFVRKHYRSLVTQAFDLHRLTPATDLVRRSTYPEGKDINLFYAQCYSFCDFLISRGGLRRFVKFSEELSLAPDSLGVLLKRHYRLPGPVAFGNAWRAKIGR